MIDSLSCIHTPSVMHLFYVCACIHHTLAQHPFTSSCPHCIQHIQYIQTLYLHSLHVCLPHMQGIPNWLKMDSDVASKFRENVFELLFYSVTWLWELKVMVGNPNNLFVDLGSHYRSE